jgi:hypothetical protein
MQTVVEHEMWRDGEGERGGRESEVIEIVKHRGGREGGTEGEGGRERERGGGREREREWVCGRVGVGSLCGRARRKEGGSDG